MCLELPLSYTSDLALLSPILRTAVEEGRYEIAPSEKWHDPLKPVILDAKTKRPVKGSGAYAKAAAKAADNGRRGGIRQSASYRDALEILIPFDLPEAEARERRMSFEKMVDLAWDAMEGKTTVDCPHAGEKGSDGKPVCGETTHRIAAQKADGKLIWSFIENFVGKAKETIETTNIEAKVNLLVQVRDVPLGVYSITPEKSAENMQKLLDEGVVDATWFEIDDED